MSGDLPESAREAMKLEKRAERIRAAFRKDAAFLETLRRSQEDVEAGRFVSIDELKRKYPTED